MKAVCIRDRRDGYLDFDVRDLLAALGPRVRESTWRVKCVEATGKAWSELAAFTGDESVPGAHLERLAADTFQTIDGLFIGFDPGAAEPWVVIEAVDTSYYVVHSADEALLDVIRARFRDVSPHDDPPFW
jgi:hypothetical protein